MERGGEERERIRKGSRGKGVPSKVTMSARLFNAPRVTTSTIRPMW